MQLALVEALKAAQQPIPPPLFVVLGYAVRPVKSIPIVSKEPLWIPNMATIYLVEQGTTLRQEQGRFLLQSPKEPEVEVPIREVERILVFGNIQVTTTVISSCLEAQIPIVFLTQLGEYKGHLWSAEFSDLDGQLAQFNCWQNPDFQLEVSQAIVWGKLMNSKQLLLRLNRKRRLPDVAAAIAGITTDITALETADNLDSLRGYEGVSAARYFPALGQLITNSGFCFTERNRRPPKDPVNSLLSFGYTLLFNNVLSLILAEGLSPYLGNFHYSDRKEPHLAFDLMEEFRSVIVDSLVLNLINKQMLKPTDFTWPNEESGIYLADGARRVFLKSFEERISDLVAHPDLQTKVSYRRAIQLQVQRYKRSLLESVPYEAFVRPV
jgi:CRISPR-associated protein Cas1